MIYQRFQWRRGMPVRVRTIGPIAEPFLRNEANMQFINNFNGGVECRRGAALVRYWRGSFLQNKPNAEFDGEFGSPKLTHHFSGTNPTGDCFAVSKVSANGIASTRFGLSTTLVPHRIDQPVPRRPRSRVAHLRRSRRAARRRRPQGVYADLSIGYARP